MHLTQTTAGIARMGFGAFLLLNLGMTFLPTQIRRMAAPYAIGVLLGYLVILICLLTICFWAYRDIKGATMRFKGFKLIFIAFCLGYGGALICYGFLWVGYAKTVYGIYLATFGVIAIRLAIYDIHTMMSSRKKVHKPGFQGRKS